MLFERVCRKVRERCHRRRQRVSRAHSEVVNLLGASAGARGRKVHCGRLHRILPLAKEEETFEDSCYNSEPELEL